MNSGRHLALLRWVTLLTATFTVMFIATFIAIFAATVTFRWLQVPVRNRCQALCTTLSRNVRPFSLFRHIVPNRKPERAPFKGDRAVRCWHPIERARNRPLAVHTQFESFRAMKFE